MRHCFCHTGLFLSLFISFTFPDILISQITVDNTDGLTLLFIGDIMGHDDQIEAARERGSNTYNYDEMFRYIKPVITEADITVANLEVTLAGPPYTGYPRFSSPASLAAACKNAGIDCIVSANNHVADRGLEGIVKTINNLDSIGLPHTGSFLNAKDQEMNSPLLINYKGISIALFNYTSGTNRNEIPEPTIVNMLDKTIITKDLQEAAGNNIDFIILYLHWGKEYDTIPSEEQIELARYFFSNGADIIIGSHPHVLQKMIWQKGDSVDESRIVIYSLGNFVSNQRNPKTDGGAMVRIELLKNKDRLFISEAGYYLTWVYMPVVNERKKYFILPCTAYEEDPGFFKEYSDYLIMKRFVEDSRLLLNRQNLNIKEYQYSIMTGE